MYAIRSYYATADILCHDHVPILTSLTTLSAANLVPHINVIIPYIARGIQDIEASRITSYNVCYTKLLR